MRQKLPFTERAAARALRAGRRAGIDVARYDIDPHSGKITVYAKDSSEAADNVEPQDLKNLL